MKNKEQFRSRTAVGGAVLFTLILVGLSPVRIFPASAAWAATLEGRVLDQQGRPIADAAVRVEAVAGTESVASTDADGRFRFPNLASGEVTLTIEAAGFATESIRDTLGEARVNREVRMQIAPVRGEVLVTATLPELATQLDIPGQAIEDAGVNDLALSMRDVAGAAALRRGTINLEPQIRGLQETQVAVFVDGTRTFAAGPARMDSGLSHIGPHAVSNLKVVKGPYALTWGAGTLSAVEVETWRPLLTASQGLDWQGSVRLGFAENADRFDGHARVGAGGERFSFAIEGGHRTGDDFEAGDGSTVPGDYESTDTRFALRFAVRDDIVLDYSGGYQEQFDLDYPGRILDATYFYTRSHNLEVSHARSGGLNEIYGQVYANRKDHRMNNDEKPTALPAPGRIPPFGLRVDLPTESNTTGGRLRFGLGRGDVEWQLGADAFVVEQEATREVRRRSNDFLIFRDIVWPEAEIENLGTYGQAVWRRGATSIGGSLRLDFVDASAGTVSDFFAANTVGDTDQSESNWSAAISVSRSVSSALALRFGLGRTVRTATALERYSDRFPSTKFQLASEFMGNPTLDPEEATELNAGFDLVQGGLRLQVDAFYRQIDDYITVSPDPSLPRRLPLSPPVVFRYINGDRATYYGGELRIDHRILKEGPVTLDGYGSLSYVWAEDEALDEPVLGIAPLTARLGFRLHAFDHRLTVDLGARIVDRQDRVAISRFEQETPGYTIYDLGAAWRAGERFVFHLAAANLGDHAYADHLNAPNPFNGMRVPEIGRSVRLGFTFDY